MGGKATEAPGRSDDPDATLIRDRVRNLDLRDDDEVTGVTPLASDRYQESDAELGRGGIGRVTIAFDRHLGRDVAIKELLASAYPKDADDTAGDLARFLREARITGQLEHPGIVPVYELGERPDGSLYYSMKLVRGRTLREAIDRAHAFTERMALLRHFVDLANAIAYAHSRGVVHRDIKPENVMLGEFGETVVLDWGLAKVKMERSDPLQTTLQNELRRLKGTEAPKTLVGEVVGTPAYMSPEQAEGAIEGVDERSDVWSLGAVLFEILTGKAPFKGKSVEFLLSQVITADFEPVRMLASEAPADLAAIAEKALSKDPRQRYPNAGALVDDVVAFQNGRQVAAYDYSAWDLLKKFVREYRVATIATLIITLTVIAGVVATLAGYRRAIAEQARAEEAQASTVAALLLAEKNKRRAHDNLSVALAEKARLLTRSLDFGAAGVFAAAALHNSPYAATSPFRYPDLEARDEAEVAKALLAPRSALYEVLVRRHLTLTDSLGTDDAQACAFSLYDGGRRLLSSDDQGRLIDWDLTRRKRVRERRGPVCPRDVAVSPSGRRALILKRDRSGVLVDLDDGSQRPVATNDGALRAVLFSDDETLFLLGAVRDVVRVRASDLSVLERAEVRSPRSAGLHRATGRLAVGTRWGTVEVLDAETLRRQRRFKDHKSSIWAVAFSEDGRRLVAGGYEGHAVIRDLETARKVSTLPGDLPIYGLRFAPGGAHVVGTGFERGRIWSISEQDVLQTYRIYGRGVRHIAVQPDRRQVITAGFGPNVQVWRFDPRPPASRFTGHAPPTYGFASRADGARIATSDGQGEIRMWDTETAQLLWRRHEPTVWALAFLDDALLSISSQGRVKRWTWSGASQILQPELEIRRGSHVGIATVGRRAAWTGAGSEVVVYDGQHDRVEARFGALEGQSSEVALSGDGQLVAAGDTEGVLITWGLQDQVVRWRRADAHDGIVSGLDFAPDGQTLASTGRDGIIRLWRASDGAPAGTLDGHGDWTNQAVFSPDGQWLLSGSDDSTARLWSVADRLPVLALPAGSQVNAVGFIAGRPRMVIGRGERYVSLPPVVEALGKPTAALLREAEQSSGLALEGFELVPHMGPPGKP